MTSSLTRPVFLSLGDEQAIGNVAHAIVRKLMYDAPLQFVHVPKTAGSSIRGVLESGVCDGWITRDTLYHSPADAPSLLRTGFVHETTVRGYRALAILREPADRFVSTFHFFKHGSDQFPPSPDGGKFANASALLRAWAAGEPSVVDGVINCTHDASRVSVNTTRDYPAPEPSQGSGVQLVPTVYASHWAAQALWIGGTDHESVLRTEKKPVLACYSHDPRVLGAELAGKTGCDALRTHLPHRNKSRRPSQFARESLSEEDRALLRVLRRADFELWDEHCGEARGG